MREQFAISTWLEEFKSFRSSWRKDLMASVVVFLVALPLCMGIAVASGVPPALGLISGIIGGLVVGVLAGSPLQVSGPAAGLAVIVWELVNKFGLAILGWIVLLAGLIQVVAGLSRFGRWFRAVSPAVIHGMLAGIGVLIFASQFHVMVDDKPRGGGLLNLLSIPEAIYKGVFPLEGTSTHHLAAMIGLMTIIILVVWRLIRPKMLSFLQGPLVAILASVAVAAFFAMRIQYVKVPDQLLSAANFPDFMNYSILFRSDIWVAALTMALVASAESLLCASAVDQMHNGERTKYDRELIAQGVGNVVSGVFGALPITGVIVRSSANVEAGGRTRWSAVLHGVWLLGFVMLIPFVLKLIPTSALAAILVFTGYKLVNFGKMKEIYRSSRSEFAIYMITLVCIVSLSLLTGVLIGIALSVLKVVWVFTHLKVKILKDESKNRFDLDIEGAATFIGLPKLAEALESLPLDAEIHVHFEHLTYIDHACLELFDNQKNQIEDAGGSLILEWDILHGKRQNDPLIMSTTSKRGGDSAEMSKSAA